MRAVTREQPGWRLLLLAFLSTVLWWAFIHPAAAGTACTQSTLQPDALANASRLGTKVFETLEHSGAQVVLIGRVGADLSHYGLRFSHLGFGVRDSQPGRWTVLHLLNHCGSDSSALYDEGLIKFFLDDPFAYEAVVATPNAETQQALTRILRSALVSRLHQPHYDTIAHPQSPHFQNSNQWALELIVAALAKNAVQSRDEAQRNPLMQFHQPDVIHIDRLTRIAGGLFKANLTFSDHPLASRIKGEYAVVTVRSVLRFLQRANLLEKIQKIDLQNGSSPLAGVDLERL